jgi:hypothetical protein
LDEDIGHDELYAMLWTKLDYIYCNCIKKKKKKKEKTNQPTTTTTNKHHKPHSLGYSKWQETSQIKRI